MDKLAFVALAALVFLIPWDNTVEFPGMGSLAQLVGIAAMGLNVLAVIITGKLRRLQAIHVFAAAFVSWTLASLLWSINFHASLERAITYAQVATLLWL